MGEVLVVNKGMAIPLLSHLGWSYFIHVFFRATVLVSFYVFLLYTLVRIVSGFCWHRGVPRL